MITYSRASIAVVIPAFNAENTIEAAIKSVLEQTDSPEEIIVVDDGSNDNTYHIIAKFGNQVRLIRQENQGSAVARQNGTIAASADYIAYLDADDWWPENKIARCREVISSEDVNFLLSDLQRARPGDTLDLYFPRNSSFFPWAMKYIKGQENVSLEGKLFKLSPESGTKLLLHGFPVFPSTVLVKRDVVQAVGGWDRRFRRCQDFDIGLRIVRNFPLHYLDEVLAILGLHEGNSDEYLYVCKQYAGDVEVLKCHLQVVPYGTLYYKQIAEAIGRKHRALGDAHRKRKQYKLARQSYGNALLWPGYKIHSMIRWLYCIRP